MEIEDLKKQLSADVAGIHMALGSAIRALIATHPDPVALAKALQYERDESLALLNGLPIPDRAIETFLAAMPLVELKAPSAMQASGSKPAAEK